MPQSLSRVVVHGVFSTKDRIPILKKGLQEELYPYLAGTLKGIDHVPIKIGGHTDHVRMLFGMSRNISVAKTIEVVKVSSSKWIKTKSHEFKDFGWQNGYEIFSVSPSDTDNVIHYISNQEEHHKVISFEDEYRALLTEFGIPFDERYVWD